MSTKKIKCRETEEEWVEDFNIEDVKDFKNHDIYCDKCGVSMGCASEMIIASFLCDNCFNELETKYAKLHPEEYSQ